MECFVSGPYSSLQIRLQLAYKTNKQTPKPKKNKPQKKSCKLIHSTCGDWLGRQTGK